MEIEFVGLKTVGGNLGQGITFLQLSDDGFDRRSGPIEIPNFFWSERKIGHKDMIDIAFQSKEGELLRFFLWEGSADDHKPMRLLPTERLVEKLGRRPILLEPLITKIAYSVFDRAGHFGYDGITNSLLVQRFDKFVVEETGIGSNTDTIDARWNFSQTFL